MSLSKAQFGEWQEGFDPQKDIKVPKGRFHGSSGLAEDFGLEHLDPMEHRDIVGDAVYAVSGWGEDVDMPISNLAAQHHIDRANARKVFESIKSRGFDRDEPITVVGDKDYGVIINGHHRAIAARAAGMKEIPATLVSWDDVYRRIQGK
jgi:hypothetical protein